MGDKLKVIDAYAICHFDRSKAKWRSLNQFKHKIATQKLKRCDFLFK